MRAASRTGKPRSTREVRGLWTAAVAVDDAGIVGAPAVRGRRPSHGVRRQPSEDAGQTPCSRQRLVIGRRRSRPKALMEIFVPGADWRRLYSARSTIRSTLSTIAGSWPAAIRSSRPAVAVDVGRPGSRPARRSRAASRCRAGRGAARRDGGLVIDDSGIGGSAPRRDRRRVAPPRQLPHQRLRHVLERVEAAHRVAVQRRVADRQLALVAGGQDQRTLLVGQCHEDDAAHPRLEVLHGQAGQRHRRQERVDHRLDRLHPVVQAGALGQVGGVVAGVVRRVLARHRDADHRGRAEGVDRERGDHRRVDAAGEAEHDRRKPFLRT